MNKKSSSKISDDAPLVTQADLDRARFRVNLQDAPRKQRVNIMLDTGVSPSSSPRPVSGGIRH